MDTSGTADPACPPPADAAVSAMAFTCSTLAHTHAHSGVLLQQVAEDTSKRLLAERRERGGLKKRAAGLAVGHDPLAIERLQVRPKLRITGEVAHIDVAVRGDQ